MRVNKIKALRGYKAPRVIHGRPSIIAPNTLAREFTVARPDQAWVTDITYIRTWQGWLYLAIVVDLYSRKVVGWSMKPTLVRDIVLDALMMAVWRRKPQKRGWFIPIRGHSTAAMTGCASANSITLNPA